MSTTTSSGIAHQKKRNMWIYHISIRRIRASLYNDPTLFSTGYVIFVREIIKAQKAHIHTIYNILYTFYKRRVKKPANSVQCHLRKKHTQQQKDDSNAKKERTYVCQLISIFLW